MSARQNEREELAQRLHETQAEISRLRQENERLRSQLADSGDTWRAAPPTETDAGRVASAASSQPQVSLEPTLFPTGEPLPAADASSPPEEKIQLFRALFRGRDDVYAVRWVDGRTGKSGYSPARHHSGGRRSDGGVRGHTKCRPLTDEVIRNHLLGRQVVGVYPLLHEDKCRFLACDFDGPGWPLDTREYRRTAQEHGVAVYIERSRSGQGGHAWIFFSALVPAVDARRLGTSLLRLTMEARAELELTSYDRFLPNQDFLPRGGFGNLIALPLQGDVRQAGNTVFLDEECEPAPDQWAFLGGVERISPAALAVVLERLPPVEVGPGTLSAGAVSSNFATRADDPPLPERMLAVLRGSLSIERSGLPPALLAALKHLASVHNPDFYQRQKLRLSTFRVPRLIRSYEEDLTHLHLPRGLLDDVRGLTDQLGITLELEDQRTAGEVTSLSFRGELKQWQEQAVEALLDHEVGVLVAPPGAGKTVIGCAVIAARSVPTLVLVHRKTILTQWRRQLAEFLGVGEDEIGQIGGGRERLTGGLDLAMLQTLARRGETAELFSPYGLVVIDECHHVPAVSFEKVVRQAPSRYVLGLTATPWRRDGLEGLIELQCGPIRYRAGGRDIGGGDFNRELLVRETSFRLPEDAPLGREPCAPAVPVHGTGEDELLSIQEVFRLLVTNENRTAEICADVESALDEGRRCLILSQWRDHCRRITEQLRRAGRRVEVLDGSLSQRACDSVLARVRDLPPDRDLAIVATGQLLGEGFNCPEIDTLFLAFPIAFKGSVVQYAGRLLRELEGKTSARIYDYADVRVPVLRRMHHKRLAGYRLLGFEKV